MNIEEAIEWATEDAKAAIEIARANDGPEEYITGNAYMPPLREFGSAERVWDAWNDDGGVDHLSEPLVEQDLWGAYVETFERLLEEAEVYLGTPDNDNSLFVVDLRRWCSDDDGVWVQRPPTCPYCLEQVGSNEWDGESGGYFGAHFFGCVTPAADGRYLVIGVGGRTGGVTTHAKYRSQLRACEEAAHLATANTAHNGHRFAVIDLHEVRVVAETRKMPAFVPGRGYVGELVG